MPRVVANGLTVHCQQAGQGEDLVLVHGLGSDLSSWFLTAMPALAEDFRVTAYDLRGHGHTDMPASGYTSLDLASDLRALLERLDIGRAHLVAHSYGGAVALQCALLEPARVASLVLAEPWIAALMPTLDLARWPHREAARAALREHGLDIPDERWTDAAFVARCLQRVTLGVGLRGTMARPGRRRQRLLDTTTAQADAAAIAGLTVERLADVRCPTLALYGALSPLSQLAGHAAAAIPHCRVEVLDGVAHYFPLTRPAMLVDAARAFIRCLAGTGAAVTRSAGPRSG